MIFNIKKGKHTCFKFPHITFKSSITAKIKLIGDFSYITDERQNQRDTNKIIGLSDNYHHHKDSIRLGYRYVDNKIEILAYRYTNGSHYSSLIGYVETDEEFEVKIEIQQDRYSITFKDVSFEYRRTSKWWGPRYFLFPYFGGQETAKKDLRFEINIY